MTCEKSVINHLSWHEFKKPFGCNISFDHSSNASGVYQLRKLQSVAFQSRLSGCMDPKIIELHIIVLCLLKKWRKLQSIKIKDGLFFERISIVSTLSCTDSAVLPYFTCKLNMCVVYLECIMSTSYCRPKPH